MSLMSAVPFTTFPTQAPHTPVRGRCFKRGGGGPERGSTASFGEMDLRAKQLKCPRVSICAAQSLSPSEFEPVQVGR